MAVAVDMYGCFYQFAASATFAIKVLSPVYAPARVILLGTAIPQYVVPLCGVDVLVVLGTFNSSSLMVVDDSVTENALPYDLDVVENFC